MGSVTICWERGAARGGPGALLRALLMLAVLMLVPVAAMAGEAPAPDANPLDPVDTSSPSATYQSFLRQTRRIEAKFLDYEAHKSTAGELALLASTQRARRLLDLDTLAPAVRDKAAGAAITYLVDILNRLPEVPAADIPGAPGWTGAKLPDKWRIPGTDIQIARVEKGPRAGEYLFTGDSVEALPRYHALIIGEPPLRPTLFANWRQMQVNFTGPLFPSWLLKQMPPLALRLVLDTPLWKEVLTVALALVAFVLVGLWGGVARRLGRGGSRVRRLGWRLSTPLLLLVLYFAVTVFVRAQINLSGGFSTGERIFSTIVLYAAGAWLAWTACFFLAEAIIASPRISDNSYDAHLLRLTARLAGVLAVGTLLLYGANDIGIPALGLVAGLGVGGIAVALASQSTLENLIGGLSIFADRPFRIGDSIRLEGKLGVVEAIGPRSSRFRALDGTLITVPNGDLAKQHIVNLSMRDKCLFLHEIGLRYETSPEQMQWLLAELRRRLGRHEMVEKAPGFPRVALTGFGDSALTLQIRAHVLTSDFNTFLKIQEELLLEIMRAVSAAGTGFAFPSQTAYLARDGGIDLERQARIAQEMERGLEREPGAVGQGRGHPSGTGTPGTGSGTAPGTAAGRA